MPLNDKFNNSLHGARDWYTLYIEQQFFFYIQHFLQLELGNTVSCEDKI